MRLVFLLLSSIVLFLGACSKDEVFPTDRVEEYIALWESQNFTQMYEMLTEETKQTYGTEQFIDRYEKIYDDLGITNLKVSFSELSDEELKQALEEKSVTYSIDVSMDSIAGSIQFEQTLALELVTETNDKEEEVQKWYIAWNPGLIFPDLADGGKIQIETERAKRGEILDRNQMPLAINDVAYEIGAVPEKFQNEAAEKEQLAELLQMSVEQIDSKLNASWVQKDHFVPLKVIPKTQEERLANLLAIPAVTYVETTGRMYPSGEAAAHLTGYVGPVTKEEIEQHPERNYREDDYIGKRGLEQLFEEELRGTDGVKVTIVKERDGLKEEILLAEKEVQHGKHVQVTIDVNIQEKMYEAYEGRGGTATAIDPKTGEILALISSPGYDPNEFAYGISESRWQSLSEDPMEPLVNRFQATYAPGSVIKPITAAIGLQNGTINPKEGIEIEGLTWAKDNWGNFRVRRVSDSGKPVDLNDALVRSDNIYFAMKAVEMGAEKFSEGLRAFGFEEDLPLSYPFYRSQISNEGNLTDEILLANSSYGQGELEVSSLHIALMYTAFINDGNIIKPALLIDDSTGEIWKENVIDQKHAETISNSLRNVVVDGTAKTANDEDFPISGKTGTAELKVSHDVKGHENGWFVGYTTEKEDLLIAMMMEKIDEVGSSSYVAKKVLDIMKEIIKVK